MNSKIGPTLLIRKLKVGGDGRGHTRILPQPEAVRVNGVLLRRAGQVNSGLLNGGHVSLPVRGAQAD